MQKKEEIKSFLLILILILITRKIEAFILYYMIQTVLVSPYSSKDVKIKQNIISMFIVLTVILYIGGKI